MRRIIRAFLQCMFNGGNSAAIPLAVGAIPLAVGPTDSGMSREGWEQFRLRSETFRCRSDRPQAELLRQRNVKEPTVPSSDRKRKRGHPDHCPLQQKSYIITSQIHN